MSSYGTVVPSATRYIRGMRSLPLALVAAAILCFAFGVWGSTSESGKRRFDEMAGMIPLASVAAGFVLLIAAAVIWWLRTRQG